MITIVEDLLSDDQIKDVRIAMASARFEDGAATAGWHAREVKRNEQAQPGQDAVTQVQQLVATIVNTNATANSATLPNRMSVPIISRYTKGMNYGAHIDDAVRPGNPPMRADVSYTVFLSDPDTYQGGELVVASGGGERKVKLPAGCAVFYHPIRCIG